MKRLISLLVILPLLASCSKEDNRGPVMPSDQELIRDLKAIEGKKIYFGHQSVGYNILDGVRDLVASSQDSQFNLTQYDTGFTSGNPFFAHSKIGQNGKPETKCDSFKSNIAALETGSPVDIALMKFCYADFSTKTNVREMFDYYRTTIDTLKTKYPHTVYVHVTAPLQRRTALSKRIIKSILGREDLQDGVILKTNEYNALVREYYKNEPVFDLAGIESTYPDGRREIFETGGTSAYAIVGDYTSDGGHLNEVGRRVAARELIRTLASVVRGGTK